MTREQAQVYAKLSREDIEKIDNGYAKHYDMICAFANGEEIESKYHEAVEWFTTELPYFYSEREYRVKPRDAAQPAERWKPKEGDVYSIIDYDGCIFRTIYSGDRLDRRRLELGNCFRTLEEAEAARERVRAALKGATLSEKETVESLDGHELSDAEKGVIRILRRCKVETMWNGPFVYLEGQKTLITCNAGVLFKFELGSKASDFGDLADDVIAEAEDRREKGEPSW